MTSEANDAKKFVVEDAFDRPMYLSRVQTYRPSTWFAKPKEVSPLVCSRKGWANIQRDVLRCTSCGALLGFDVDIGSAIGSDSKVITDLVENLTLAHDPLCQWASAECPVEFEQVCKAPRGMLLGSLVDSLGQLNKIWDLPKVKPTILEYGADNEVVMGKLKELLEWNRRKMRLAYSGEDRVTFNSCLDGAVQADVREMQNVKMVSIALLGWKVRTLSCKVYLQEQDSEGVDGNKRRRKRQWRKVYTKKCNSEKGYILGRQTILRCEHCSTQLGMWAFGSEPGMELLEFQRISARNAARAQGVKSNTKYSDIDTPEFSAAPKEVEKMLDNTIAGGAVSKFGLKLESGVFGSAAASALFEAGTPASEVSRPSLESLLTAATPVQTRRTNKPAESEEESDADAPVFGLGSYKKRKVHSAVSVESQLVEDLHSASAGLDVGPEDYVELVDGPPFDPVGQHRYFCPWREGWRDVLNTLVN